MELVKDIQLFVGDETEYKPRFYEKRRRIANTFS